MLALFATTAVQPAPGHTVTNGHNPAHGFFLGGGVGATREVHEKCTYHDEHSYKGMLGTIRVGYRWGQNLMFCNLEFQSIFTNTFVPGGMLGVNFNFGFNLTKKTSLYLGLPCTSLMLSIKKYMHGPDFGVGMNLFHVGVETEINKKLRVFVEAHVTGDNNGGATNCPMGATVGVKYFFGMN